MLRCGHCGIGVESHKVHEEDRNLWVHCVSVRDQIRYFISCYDAGIYQTTEQVYTPTFHGTGADPEYRQEQLI